MNKGEPRMPMPRMAAMPPARNIAPPPEEELDPEVIKIAQQDRNRKRQIAELELDRDEWRRKCLDSESELKRLEARLAAEESEHKAKLAEEKDGHDQIVGKLVQERDYWKDETNRVTTCARNGSVIFLQILDPPHRSTEAGDKADKVGLAAVADELVKEALPHVVVAGPRDYPQKDEPTGGAS